MLKRNHNAARRFAAALAITLLLAAGASGILLSLRRMEETMKGGSYTLFSVREAPMNRLEVTALERSCQIDLSGLQEAGDRLQRLVPVAPSAWSLFSTAVWGVVEWLSGWIARLF